MATGGLAAASAMANQLQHGVDKDTIFMCHCQGTPGGTTFVDSSVVGRTVTAVGSAQTSATQSFFGGSALQIISTAGRITIPSAADIIFGTGDWTIETWVYPNSAVVASLCQKRANSSAVAGPIMLMNSSVSAYTMLVGIGGSFPINTNFGTLTTGAWAHIAIERFGSQFNAYYNGTRTNCGTNAGSVGDDGSVMGFGADNDAANTLVGYQDNIRVSKVARYQSANFTPPVMPYTP